MPQPKKPRRRYVRKLVDQDPIGLAIDNAALLIEPQRTALLGPVMAAFEDFRAGKGTEDAVRTLADAINVASELAKRNIANDHSEKFDAAEAVLCAVMDRKQAGGNYTLRGPEICTLDDALFIHRIQLEHCSQRELRESIDRLKRRAQGALSGNVPKGVRVFVPGHVGRQVGGEVAA